MKVTLGYCHCGCGERTPLAKRNRYDKGHVRGKPVAYVLGHNGRRTPEPFGVVATGHLTACWLWKRYIGKGGYGMVRDEKVGKVRLAHRVFYERAKGPIPEGLTLDHLCRVRHCVNPDHLEAVTLAENSRRGANAKLTPADVEEIRNSPLKGSALARKLGVSETTITNVRRGRTWAEAV